MSIDPLISYRGLIVARYRKIRAKLHEVHFQPVGLSNRKVEGSLSSKTWVIRFLTARTLPRALCKSEEASTFYFYLCTSTASRSLKCYICDSHMKRTFGLLSRYANIPSKSSEESYRIEYVYNLYLLCLRSYTGCLVIGTFIDQYFLMKITICFTPIAIWNIFSRFITF